MEKVIFFVIMNVITSAILGIIGFLFLFFVIYNLKGQNYNPYLGFYDSGSGFWMRFGMLIMFILFALAIWYGIQIAPILNLSTDGACIICIFAAIYFFISCRVTDNEIGDLLF